VIDNRQWRRWIGAVTFLLALAVAVWAIPRLGVRSPLTFVLLPILAVLTMKLVERRVGQWFRRWAEKSGRRAGGPGSKGDQPGSRS
jgi:hypothetical protein